MNIKKDFFVKIFIYRGTKDFPGLTMGLIKDSNAFVNGILFRSTNEKIIPFIKSFVKRETPIDFNETIMNIYTYEFVKIILPDKINVEYAITCVVNPNSLVYLNNKLTLKEQAIQIGQAYGINGTNFQYLDKLTFIYQQFNIQDSFTNILEILHYQSICYRQSLSTNIQKWFLIYDQLQTLEQRKQAVQIQQHLTIIQPFIYHSTYFEQSQQITSN